MRIEEESVAKLARRVSNIPELLRRTLNIPLRIASSALREGVFVVTGAGIAAGPARFLATHLRHDHGLAARYCPPSAFAGSASRPQGDTLVVFSQSLSANAQMVLEHAPHYAHVTLISSVCPDPKGTKPERRVAALVEAGVELIQHEPRREDGMLVRVLGPAAATLQGVRWASAFGEPEALRPVLTGLPIAVQAALDRVDDIKASLAPGSLLGDVAFITVGGYGAACRGLSWKWMEGLWASEPPLWDVLQVVHGPLQTFWERDMTLIALVGPDPLSGLLLDRLERVLHPDRHRLIRLSATIEGALSVLEHGAALDGLMLWALNASPRDLSQWPAKGVDEPLYGLAKPLENSEGG